MITLLMLRRRVGAALLACGLGAVVMSASPRIAHGQAEAAPGETVLSDSSEVPVDQVEGLLFGNRASQVEFHGFLNVEAYSFQGQAEHCHSSFDLHNFFFAAKAPISQDVTVFGEVEYEHGATIRLDRAFVEWTLSPWATFRFGRFYVPLSYERPHYWAPVRLMTSRPLLVDIPFHEWADTGFELFGRRGWFGYDLAILNGPFALTENGIPIADVRDNNKNKVPVTRIVLQPLPSLELGAAHAWGKYDTHDSLRFDIFELDGRLHPGPLDVWAEYSSRRGDDEPTPTGGPGDDHLFTGDRARKTGFYVLAAYEVIQGKPHFNYLKPLLRFDRYAIPGDGLETQRWTAGLNWSPEPHFVVKTEYQRRLEVRGPKLNDDGFMGSLVVDF